MSRPMMFGIGGVILGLVLLVGVALVGLGPDHRGCHRHPGGRLPVARFRPAGADQADAQPGAARPLTSASASDPHCPNRQIRRPDRLRIKILETWVRYLTKTLQDQDCGQNGRSSNVPTSAVGCRAAISMASSMLAHSMTSKPAICSLVSANGPSLSSTSPSLTRTVVASPTGRSLLAGHLHPGGLHLGHPGVYRLIEGGVLLLGPVGVQPGALVQVVDHQVFHGPSIAASCRGYCHDEREGPRWTDHRPSLRAPN